MARIRLVDPIKSLRARQRDYSHCKGSWKAGDVINPHGIGGPLTGEVLNPTGKGGFGDNPPKHVLIARKKGQFKPGQSANPYGRAGKPTGISMSEEKPKRDESIVKEAREIRDMAREGVPKAIQALIKIIESEVSSDMAKIAAYHALADRGYGKPTQTNVNANVDPDSKPSTVNAEELEKRIAETIQRIERIESTPEGTEKPVISEKRSSNVHKLN